MAPMSQAVRRLGRDKCELCLEPGIESNPLTRHHCDGDHENNEVANFMVAHRWRCHTFADAITQMGMNKGVKITPDDIIWAWRLITTSGWLLKLIQERKR